MVFVGVFMSLVAGAAVGIAVRKNIQKNLCPFCECSYFCSIGYSVERDKHGTKGCALCMKGR